MFAAMSTDRVHTADRPSRPRWTYLLLLELVVLGTAAIAGGGALMLDPTGERLGLSIGWLQDSIFITYLLPGTILFTGLGVGSFVVGYGLVRRTTWAWPAGVALGIATVAWILVQLAIVRRYFVLQPVIAGIGASIVLLLLLPSMREYYRADRPPRKRRDGSAG